HLDPSDTVDFGSPLINTGITRTIIARNESNDGPLVISNVRLTSDTSTEYALGALTLPITLQPNQETVFAITYTLVDSTADLGVVLIQSDAASCDFNCADPQNVRVALFSEFKGGKDLTLDPTLHDFGFVDVGQSSAAFSIAAGNEGTFQRFLTI